MNIGKIPYYARPSIGYAFGASMGDRVSLPVSPASYIYSHFRHVSGFPASNNVQGISINRLKILDTMIEALVRMKQQPRPAYGTPGEEDDEKRLDAMINSLQGQLRNAKATQTAAPYPAVSPDLGVMLNISA